jgi:O-antigen ligase
MLTAAGALIAIIWSTFATLHLQHHPNQRRALILWTVGLAHLTVAFQPRTDLPFALNDTVTINSPLFVAASRLFRAGFVVGIAATVAANWRVRRPASGRALWAATLGLTGAVAVSSLFGATPTFDPLMVGLPALATCLYLDRAALDWTTRQAHHVTLVWTMGSLAAWVAAPEWANLTSTATYGSFLDRTLRLRGLADHPNQLGAVAALGLLLSVWRHNARWRPLWIAGTATTIVLSGSRTSLVTACAMVGLAIYFSKARSIGRLAGFTLAAALVVVPVTAVTSAETLIGNAYLAGATTFQSRTDVWDATLTEFTANPIAGYGPGLWSPAYQAAKGAGWEWVGQAHSQYAEALGSGGIIGFTALAWFCAALLATAWRTHGRDRGLALAAGIGLCIEMITESALSLGSFPPAALPALVTAIAFATCTPATTEAEVAAEREMAAD